MDGLFLFSRTRESNSRLDDCLANQLLVRGHRTDLPFLVKPTHDGLWCQFSRTAACSVVQCAARAGLMAPPLIELLFY